MDDDKRKNIELNRWTVTLIALCLLSASTYRGESKVIEMPPAAKPAVDGEPNVVAQSAAVIDSYTGEFLFLKNENALQYPASSTKILTALLVIEAGDLDKVVTVDLSDTKVEPSNLELKPGEQYTRRQLLY
jgi:serine-type D-Ala-D-Ala carboxypeptidase (penicillin-binding protein 5/6)